MLTHDNLVSFMAAARETAPDEAALQAISVYPLWKENTEVKEKSRYQHNGVLYRCIQAHTTQADWTPDITPALWAVVSLEEWPQWAQPLGSEDAYVKGAKVTHKETKYISDVDANVWEPGVYGWNVAE